MKFAKEDPDLEINIKIILLILNYKLSFKYR